MKKKKHVTVPRIYKPGKGHPAETLAYLNPMEHELIRQLTDGTYQRGPMGVKSYAVDKDTLPGGRSPGSGGSNAGNGSSPSNGGGPGGPNGPNSGPSSSTSSSSSSNQKSQQAQQAADAAASEVKKSVNAAAAAAAAKNAPTLSNVAKVASNTAMMASPNAAAQAAYDKAKYSAMSNRYDPVTVGAAPSIKGTLPGASPADFARTALGYNVNRMNEMGVTDANRIVGGFNNMKQFSDMAYDPAGVQKIRDNLGYTPVGIRTNNPGNLLNSSWQKGVPGYSGPVTSPNGLTYSSYTDPRWGMVAQNELLGRYSDMGRNTINSVVDRYAPVDENNSAAANANYKSSLSRATGWGPDTPLTREQVQSLGPYKTAFENGGVAFAGGPFGGTQVAGIGSPGIGQAARQQQAAQAASALTRLASMQGPNMPPQAIPAPSSMGMLPPSAFPNDPRMAYPTGGYPARPSGPPKMQDRLNIESPVGSISPAQINRLDPADQQRLNAYAQTPTYSPPPSQYSGDPRVGMPTGAFPAAPARSTTQVVTDPRTSLTPLGSLPPAKNVAWNVPPMGGALPPGYGDIFGQWGSAHMPPPGPAASPGVSGSMTADASPSQAMPPQTAPSQQEAPKGFLGSMWDKMMNGPGASLASGGFDDRSYQYRGPEAPQTQMASAGGMMARDGAQPNSLLILLDLQKNMIAQGASPEELAYVQSLIDDVSQKVA